ncbi:MAG: hypothetical protein ACYTEZ_17105 [Planctomycetota bacterium]|jgi:hypothetical protein
MRWSVIALSILAACASSPQGLVRRAVKASGGSRALGEVHSYHVETEGVYQGEPYTAISHLRDRSDWRWDMKGQKWEMNAWVLGDEQSTYTQLGGKTVAPEGPQREATVMHQRVECSMLLPDRLLAEDVTLEKAEPVTINETACPAVHARFGDSPPVTYVFDPFTHRIKQIHFRMLGPDGRKEVPAVIDLVTYEEIDGIQVARSMFMSWGEEGKRTTMREEIKRVLWNPEIPAETLAVPEVSPPPEIVVKEMPSTIIAQYTHRGPYDQIGDAIGKVVAWIEAKGGEVTGSPAVLYPELDMQSAVIQVPARLEQRPEAGEIQLMRRRSFRFAHAKYEGGVEGPVMLLGNVTAWCTSQGYRPSGYARVEYLTVDPETMQCVAEVGFPVRETRAEE